MPQQILSYQIALFVATTPSEISALAPFAIRVAIAWPLLVSEAAPHGIEVQRFRLTRGSSIGFFPAKRIVMGR
jgi:hypothetical protein